MRFRRKAAPAPGGVATAEAALWLPLLVAIVRGFSVDVVHAQRTSDPKSAGCSCGRYDG